VEVRRKKRNEKRSWECKTKLGRALSSSAEKASGHCGNGIVAALGANPLVVVRQERNNDLSLVLAVLLR
jgi:hypothetical protein